MMTYRGPRILNLSPRFKQMVTFMRLMLYPSEGASGIGGGEYETLATICQTALPSPKAVVSILTAWTPNISCVLYLCLVCVSALCSVKWCDWQKNFKRSESKRPWSNPGTIAGFAWKAWWNSENLSHNKRAPAEVQDEHLPVWLETLTITLPLSFSAVLLHFRFPTHSAFWGLITHHHAVTLYFLL